MHSNRLIQEKSPYLQQHAHNPVDWYPWGEEAFEKARSEDKPIFLSIGYSTCHWCHVMEHESFENEGIAALVNRWFVPIKVDREERPDIDRIYMNYVQATTGGGGWPMSVWLTPELKPFVGGTYFPPDNRYGRAGFPVILERIAQAWQNDRQKILETSAGIMEQLREQAEKSGSGGADRVDPSTLDSAFNQFRRSFDSKLGGFGAAPKFPRPSVHNFLLRYWKRTGRDEARDMVVETLLAMEKGGMHDQLGGGFHRYSVDEYWFVPHFEKMLYDQAQLVISYLEAFQITQDETLARAARRTLDYVMRDMTAPDGGFYSAEDADSASDPTRPNDKSEGAFYIWSYKEVVDLLGEERAQLFARRYGMEADGNVANDPHHEFTGRNILFQAQSAGEIGEAEKILFEARAKRPRPHLDDKILTSWNGLMISAFAKGAAILEEPAYAAAARRAADFLLNTMQREGGTLLRRFRDGDAAIPGMLDDYAFFAQGLLDLYESTLEFRWLGSAMFITGNQMSLLEDKAGGFFASAHEDASRLMRIKDDYDGAEPSGNSVALMNLLRLDRMTGREEFGTSARKLISAFQPKLAVVPFGMPQMLAAAEFDLAPQREIVVAGDASNKMLWLLWEKFDPNRILLYADPQLAAFNSAIAAMCVQQSGTTVYVCEDFTCQQPVTREEDLARLLR
jgi:uncharacterized protein